MRTSRLIKSTTRLVCRSEASSFQNQRRCLLSFLMELYRIQILFNEDLSVKFKGFRILLDQEDQLLMGMMKILQAFDGQDHSKVKIKFVLLAQRPITLVLMMINSCTYSLLVIL